MNRDVKVRRGKVNNDMKDVTARENQLRGEKTTFRIFNTSRELANQLTVRICLNSESVIVVIREASR